MSKLTLISHPLCPYVQRIVIVLAEKGTAFVRTEIDLANKPAWFLTVSPLGKTPVLLVEDTPIFESAAICEYLEDAIEPRLHPANPVDRARHRGWMEFGSSILNAIGAFYSAKDEDALQRAVLDIRRKFGQIEAILGDGPYFNGKSFSVVDAVFGPVFRYFDVFDARTDFGFFAGQPKVGAWRAALAKRPSVRDAVRDDYPQRLTAFLEARQSALVRHMRA